MGDVFKARRSGYTSRKWYGIYVDADGKRKQVALCEDKQTARILLARKATEALRIREGILPVSAASKSLSVENQVSEWLKTISPGNRQLTGYRLRYFTDRWSTLQDVNGRAAYQWVQALDVSETTRRYYWQVLQWWVKWLGDKLPRDPLGGLSVPRGPKPVRREYSDAEIAKLLAAEQPYRKLAAVDRRELYATALGTGFRAGELASLNGEDFDGQTLRLRGVNAKNGREVRQPLPGWLSERLTAWVGNRKQLWPGSWLHDPAQMVRFDGVDRLFHELRHTYVSRLIRAGVNPKDVQVLARHSTFALTMDVYSHAGDLLCAIRALPCPGVCKPVQ